MHKSKIPFPLNNTPTTSMASTSNTKENCKTIPPPLNRHVLRRRSKSVADLRLHRDKILLPKKLVTKMGSTTNVNSASKSLVKKPEVKTTVKRPAPVTNNVDNKKVKIVPYDYKARYNLQVEKYAKLEQLFQESKTTLQEVIAERDILQIESTNTKNKLQKLELNYNVLKNQFDDIELKHNNLIEAHKKLNINYTSALNINESQEKDLQFYKATIQSHEEVRRILHNQLQDLKGTIRVFCRIRPPTHNETDKILYITNYMDEETIQIQKNKENINCINGKPSDSKFEFSYDKVFAPQIAQSEIFEELAQLVQSALDGYNVCVFAYGQTGSGKTYTMQGEDNESDLGMIPRTIELIFQIIAKLKKVGWTYTVDVSFLEIYNEIVKDLLQPESREVHEIKYNEGKGTTVTNLNTVTVTSENEIKQLMLTANQNRAVAVTNFNEHSSRSHAVTKIVLQGTNSNQECFGSLNLVDLAGSESAKFSSSERITETISINKSLSTLGTVMHALHNKENHIPYRNSKLTYLLQSSLGGNSKTLMFVNVAPFEECFKESINALRFASNVKEIKMSTKRNKTVVKNK